MKVTVSTPNARVVAEMPAEKALGLLYAALEGADKGFMEDAEAPPYGRGAGNDEASAEETREIEERPVAMKIVDEPKAPTPTKKPKKRKAYKGFLYLECEDCGKKKGFFAHSLIDEYSCSCGHMTKLEGLCEAEVVCHACGNKITYQTNMIDRQFEIECLRCKAPVQLELTRDADRYVTVEENRDGIE